MKHTELVEVLTRLTDAVEDSTNEVKRLNEKVEGLATQVDDFGKALGQWHSDNEARESVISEAIERNRERLTEHGKRLRTLEGKGHSPGE